MRKLFLLIACFICLTAAALDFEPAAGETAVLRVQDNDTLLIFSGEPHLTTKSTVGSVDWYYTDGTLLQTATDEVWPESGRGVTFTYQGRTSTAYVFDYIAYRPSFTAVAAEPHCDRTVLTLTGSVPPMTYTSSQGTSVAVDREMTIRYTDLGWGENEWVDSVVTTTQYLAAGFVSLPPFYGENTTFTIVFDDVLTELGTPDSIVSAPYQPLAVKCHITSETTTRENTDKLNEPKRPVTTDQLTGSGPLEVLFRLNPTPAAEYFEWIISQSAATIAQRMDETTRYTFTEPGNYTAHGRAYNNVCPCASEEDCQTDESVYSGEIAVSVSESFLKVPNVFTPNGDGKNDEFRVAYQSLREFHCWVYNRWGHLVYSWDDPAKGWDGMIGGRPAAEGAYFYVIRALGTDAPKNASYGTKMQYKKKIRNADESILGVYRLSGAINLIRGRK